MESRHKIWPVIWQGALLAPVLLAGFLLVLGVAYQSNWSDKPQWFEAWRHRHRLYISLERLIHLRWVHFDARYWLLPVDFSDGPVTLEGEPPEGTYWSATWYTDTSAHPSINSENVELEPDGTYRVTLSSREQSGNWLRVPENAGRGNIYIRVYQPPSTWPTRLPTVRQNGRVLVEGGLW